MTGHSFDHEALISGGQPHQQSFDEASVGGFQEEEDEQDDSDTPVDEVEDLKGRVVRVGVIPPAHHEGGALGKEEVIKVIILFGRAL